MRATATTTRTISQAPKPQRPVRAVTGQAGLYVEASRARDRFVLVTDNRESLEENDGVRLTAQEAVGEADLSGPPAGCGDPDAA